MHIISSKEKTDHVLIAVCPFSPYGSEDDFIQYEFAYFELSETLKEKLSEYTTLWREGKSRIHHFPIEARDILLLEGAAINNIENSENPDYNYIKYDSMSFLKEPPVFDETDKYYKIDGRFLCSFKEFQLEIERIPDGHKFQSVIYRSPIFIYYDILDKNLIK